MSAKISVVDFTSPTASQDFAASLREIGFGVLSHHPIDQVLIDDVYALWYDFFKHEADPAFSFDKEKHDGHITTDLSETAKGFTQKDIKEFYHYYEWGRCPEKQKAKTHALYEALSEMAKTLLSWLEAHMPEDARKNLSMPLSNMIDGSQRHLFRLIHYPPLTGNEPEGALRAADHEDIDLLTLLPAATAKGLQAKDRDGNWIDVPCNPGWIIVNAGDMLQEATDFYYPSTTHRVVNPTGDDAKQSRLSMPLFFHAQDDVPLSARYPTAEAYRLERYRELGLL